MSRERHRTDQSALATKRLLVHLGSHDLNLAYHVSGADLDVSPFVVALALIEHGRTRPGFGYPHTVRLTVFRFSSLWKAFSYRFHFYFTGA